MIPAIAPPERPLCDTAAFGCGGGVDDEVEDVDVNAADGVTRDGDDPGVVSDCNAIVDATDEVDGMVAEEGLED
jgi:hypothetical protein